MILAKYGIKNGVLVVDDKDHSRSKNAEHLHGLHKIKDKRTGGYILGQNIVLLYLVTDKFCIPVSFSFYIPDPALKAWNEKDKALKRQGVTKKDRPKKPERLEDYPKKYEIALKLLKDFAKALPKIKISSVLADALYGNSIFIDEIGKIWPDIQVISQLRANQKIKVGKRTISCQKYFKSYQGWSHDVSIRGQKAKKVVAGGVRALVCSHEKKRFVIALKYEGEAEYRYFVASNLTWNIKEVIQACTLRWYSLLFDHCFLFHFRQQIFIENKLPLVTLRNLIEKSRFEALCEFIKNIVHNEDSKQEIRYLEEISDVIFPCKTSKKHLSGLSGQMRPNEKKSLKI